MSKEPGFVEHVFEEPLLAITMGDPAGCGPEIIAHLFSRCLLPDHRLVVIGDAGVLRKAASLFHPTVRINAIQDLADGVYSAGVLNVLDLRNVSLDQLQVGKVQREAGQAAYETITTGIDLAMQGRVGAVVTGPINKESLRLAGHHFDGHTEIFASRTNTAKVTMLLVSGNFRVTHVSTHCALRAAIERVTPQRVLDVIRLSHQGVQRLGIANPRIAVAGLNPHSSENGLFGCEEQEKIQPAIDEAIRQGFQVYPIPVPPDTVFVRMREMQEFDLVVAQYHDQGHIAAKLVDFWGGVNISLGLPIIRTSVDHGTAFDIAYTGKANPISLRNAIQLARTMTRNPA